MKYRLHAIAGIFLSLLLISPGGAGAQTPPSSTQAAAYSGLHAAAYTGDADAARRLLAAGADLEARDGAGRTPLHVAAFQSQGEILSILVEGGGDINALDHAAYDVITIAAVADDVEILRLALTLGGNPGNVTSPYDGTALIAAAHLGHVEVVRTLIEAGAPLDHVNNLHWTALMEAVVLGNGGPRYVEIVRLLIRAGANAALADGEGVSPLEHARRRGFEQIAAVIAGAAK